MPEKRQQSMTWQDRDIVRFYARLTRSVEERFGKDCVASCLSALRKAAAEPVFTTEDDVDAALVRFFRRLGFVDSTDDMALFLTNFLALASESIARPKNQIFGLLRAMTMGIDGSAERPICSATPVCKECRLSKECEHFNNPRKPEMAVLPAAKKLLELNGSTLSDAELLAVLLFGDRGTGTELLVKALFQRYGRLRAIFNADPHEYAGLKDINDSQVLRLAAVAEMYRRLLRERRDQIDRIVSAKDFYDRYAPELRDYKIEAAVLVLLDQKHGIMRDVWFTHGSSNMTHVAIPELLRPAIRDAAPGLALVHNHPSGDPTPSMADHDFTRRLRTACDIVGIGLVDHVVVTEGGYFSFAEEGQLGKL